MSKISIIVPVYNAAETLPDCLKSILSQEGVDFEVILVNDGSTDDSGIVCDRLAAADPRVTAIHQLNGGVSSARNAGLEAATGEYVAFVDADDALLEGALKNMSTENADLVVAGYIKGNLTCTPADDQLFATRNSGLLRHKVEHLVSVSAFLVNVIVHRYAAVNNYPRIIRKVDKEGVLRLGIHLICVEA